MKRLVALFALAVTSAALAQDPAPPAKPPAEEYQDRLSRINKTLADEIFKIAEWLTSVKMHAMARSEYNKVITLNTDHEGARKALCYARNDSGEWDIDPTKRPPTDKAPTGDEALKIKVNYDKRMEQMGKTLGSQWSSLGDFCDKNAMPTEAAEAWKKAIELDPQNSNSRKKLKYERAGKDGPWLSPFEAKIRKELFDGWKKLDGGQTVKEQSKVETDIAVKHEKRRSKHYMIEAGGMDQEKLKVVLQQAEHAYAIFLKYFDQTELLPQEFAQQEQRVNPAH